VLKGLVNDADCQCGINVTWISKASRECRLVSRTMSSRDGKPEDEAATVRKTARFAPDAHNLAILEDG